MTRVNFSQHQCSIAQSLSTVGDIWSFLIIRDAMAGSTRFSDFENNLGIAKNILRNRLVQLVDNKLLLKIEVGQTGSRHEYQLSQKAIDLFPVFVALYQWSEKWIEEDKQSPFTLTGPDGRKIGTMFIPDSSGNPISIQQVNRIPKSR